MMTWGKLLSRERLVRGKSDESGFLFSSDAADPYRSDYYRDGDRILFSHSFRRMQDKTQVYPLPENDHVHSRLTHSIEVASIGRSIAQYIGFHIRDNSKIKAEHEDITHKEFEQFPSILGDVVYAACLAHDIGNPPFGHSGEDAIGAFFQDLFKKRQSLARDIGDRQCRELEKFEGNAQGFRRITRLQNKKQGGLRLTAATLAAFCKYPRVAGKDIDDSHPNNISTKKFGCFMDDERQLRMVAEKVDLIKKIVRNSGDKNTEINAPCYARHPLAFLVEAADNMSYLILDLEDGIRLGYVSANDALLKLCSIANVPYGTGTSKDDIPELRSQAINRLRSEVCSAFIQNYESIMRGDFPHELTDVIGSKELLTDVKHFTRKYCYQHKYVDEMAVSGSTILHGLLTDFIDAVINESTLTENKKGMLFRLADVDPKANLSNYQKILLVTDYISGMTDSFAARLFRKLHGIDVSSDIR